MAKIIKKGRNLEEEFFHYRNQIKEKMLLAFLFFVIAVEGIIISVYINQIIVLLSLFLVILAVRELSSIAKLKSKIDIIESGIAGENLTNRCIALLPESYTAFCNLTISYKGKSSEIDILLIGPTGIYVIETKNLAGSIYGSISDTHWTQYKIGRAGTPYSKAFYSPAKQVNTHVYRVANYLRENGIHTYVNAVVYFSNINTSVEVSDVDEKTMLFFARDDGANKMLHYICNNNQQMSQNECESIISLFQNI